MEEAAALDHMGILLEVGFHVFGLAFSDSIVDRMQHAYIRCYSMAATFNPTANIFKICLFWGDRFCTQCNKSPNATFWKRISLYILYETV